MANAFEIHGSVFERGSAVLLARVTDAGGQPIQSSDIASMVYSVSELDRCSEQYSPVLGHDGETLSVAATIFDTLQTDAAWDVDATGYNFRHEIDVSSNDAFPNAGTSYRVRYELQPTSGQKIVFRFLLRAI